MFQLYEAGQLPKLVAYACPVFYIDRLRSILFPIARNFFEEIPTTKQTVVLTISSNL
jgi:hypothetical protein